MKPFFIILIICAAPFFAVAQGGPGELNLTATGTSRLDYIERQAKRFQRDISGFNTDQLAMIKYFESELRKGGLPGDLKAIAFIESYLNIRAVSHAGASGPWQIMPATGREVGLVIADGVDERYDVYKSTRAAISILRGHYRTYSDWYLVLAAYNAGAGRVNNAIRKAGSRNIWNLEPYLPEETNLYVKKFIAAAMAWNGKTIPDDAVMRTAAGSAPAQIVAAPAEAPKVVTLNSVISSKEYTKGTSGQLATEEVSAGYRLDVIAKMLDLPEKKVREWNRHFEKEMAKKGVAKLVLPKDKMIDFLFNKSEIIQESLQQSLTESM